PLNKRSRRVISASKWVRAECEQALGLSAESVVRIGLVLLHRHLLEPFSVHVAVADRSVRTPISARGLSAAQNVEHAEEDRLPWVPGQQPVHQAAAGADDLARHTQEGIHKCLELHRQDGVLLTAVALGPAAGLLGQL